jgi:hypothetical protein
MNSAPRIGSFPQQVEPLHKEGIPMQPQGSNPRPSAVTDAENMRHGRLLLAL